MNRTGPRQSSDAALRDAYGRGALYETSRVCRHFNPQGDEYVDRLLYERFRLVDGAYHGGVLVDLCCASGAHLVDLSKGADIAIGLDFSERYLAAGRALAAKKGRANVVFLGADARSIPLADNSVDCLYCFSSLYAIPRSEEIVQEIGRVLKQGGRAVLDFGNRRSLNIYCLKFYKDWPGPHPLTVGEIMAALRAAGLSIEVHRCFQLLPLWAGLPKWLGPLLHPVWTRFLKRRVAGRMLDEWISGLPILRMLAFRHLVVAEKRGSIRID